MRLLVRAALLPTGLLPVPIVASSAGPISLPDVASLAVGAARGLQAPGPVSLSALVGEAGGARSMLSTQEGVGPAEMMGGEVGGCQQGQGDGLPSLVGELSPPQQGQQQQQQQQQEGHQEGQEQEVQGQQQQQLQQGPAAEDPDQDDEDDESYRCYGNLHAPQADASMAGDDDDEAAFYPQVGGWVGGWCPLGECASNTTQCLPQLSRQQQMVALWQLRPLLVCVNARARMCVCV